MASSSLSCPMCCNETFDSHSSLKYHLLSIIENLLCPSCNERFDDVMDLASHLSTECRNLHQEPDKVYVNSVGADTPKLTDQNQIILDPLQIKKEHEDSLDSEEQRILYYDENGQRISATNEENETMVYTCQVCNVQFTSLQEHLTQYHEGEEIVLESDDNVEATLEGDGPEEELFVLQGDDDENDQYQSELEEILVEEELDQNDPDYQVKRSKRRKIEIENEELQEPDITKYIVDNGEVRKIGEEEAAQILDQKSVIEIYNCKNCKLQFPHINHYNKHKCSNAKKLDRRKDRKKLKNIEELRYQCTFCQAIYSSLIALNDHMKSHLVEDDSGMVQKKRITMSLHICEICNTKFPSYKQLRLHGRMHDPIKDQKIDPPVSYNILGQPKNVNQTEQGVFECEICHKSYNLEYKEAHLKSHDDHNDELHCLICNKKFDSIENLTLHKNAHTNNKKFSCSYCKKPFLNYDALENHVNQQCFQKRKYECQHCGRRFLRPHEKVKHERIHTGEKPHICPICNKAFRVAYCLTLHMRTHTGVRPYSCPQCEKRFKSLSVYNHHMLIHSDERKFKCTFCSKAFKTAVQLAGHKNSHTKPFSCSECNRPFASLFAVKVHRETHNKENGLRFECYVCGASYARSFALKDHMEEAHKGASMNSDNHQGIEERQIFGDDDDPDYTMAEATSGNVIAVETVQQDDENVKYLDETLVMNEVMEAATG